jgi:hypothetical protein
VLGLRHYGCAAAVGCAVGSWQAQVIAAKVERVVEVNNAMVLTFRLE